ncbi:hypothetical protein PAXRUDRAFT_834661 [Paxillus rubicundulus Ve08.2h10]|uniref:Unplaced genomic scaffold scaffold_1844, whole genome shotgun sequence n=1 Tax=Paxillus rubicundulus Ve08.2h10 TaxID=930991 RepID=A0A0D0D3T3_9AGAM|nr:hypothetical protein PAXRUDRAFT_834661 [Paxillus rubicundulus Ve08.2h10]
MMHWCPEDRPRHTNYMIRAIEMTLNVRRTGETGKCRRATWNARSGEVSYRRYQTISADGMETVMKHRGSQKRGVQGSRQ